MRKPTHTLVAPYAAKEHARTEVLTFLLYTLNLTIATYEFIILNMSGEVFDESQDREFDIGAYHFQELINPDADEADTEVILRICNHPLRPDAMEVLKKQWGKSIRVLTTRNVAYGEHPDEEVSVVIEALTGEGYDVVAVEPVGKPEHVAKIIAGLALHPEAPMVIRAEFEQDGLGRKTVVGHDPVTRREIFRCTNYVELVPDRGAGEGQ